MRTPLSVCLSMPERRNKYVNRLNGKYAYILKQHYVWLFYVYVHYLAEQRM